MKWDADMIDFEKDQLTGFQRVILMQLARQADAMERQADALEKLAGAVYSEKIGEDMQTGEEYRRDAINTLDVGRGM